MAAPVSCLSPGTWHLQPRDTFSLWLGTAGSWGTRLEQEHGIVSPAGSESSQELKVMDSGEALGSRKVLMGPFGKNFGGIAKACRSEWQSAASPLVAESTNSGMRRTGEESLAIRFWKLQKRWASSRWFSKPTVGCQRQSDLPHRITKRFMTWCTGHL